MLTVCTENVYHSFSNRCWQPAESLLLQRLAKAASCIQLHAIIPPHCISVRNNPGQYISRNHLIAGATQDGPGLTMGIIPVSGVTLKSYGQAINPTHTRHMGSGLRGCHIHAVASSSCSLSIIPSHTQLHPGQASPMCSVFFSVEQTQLVRWAHLLAQVCRCLYQVQLRSTCWWPGVAGLLCVYTGQLGLLSSSWGWDASFLGQRFPDPTGALLLPAQHPNSRATQHSSQPNIAPVSRARLP